MDINNTITMTERDLAISDLAHAIYVVTTRDNINLGKISNHLVKTPERIIKVWEEFTSGYNMTVDMALSPAETSVGMIMERNIEFSSICAHHFLTFDGSIDIAYIPGEYICGASKLARVVEMFSKRLQLQEFLGDDIVDYLLKNLQPKALAVKIHSKHTCIACRGIKARNAEFVTYHSRNIGAFGVNNAMEVFR
jgi:GTP cyclohydrolase I